MRDSEIVQPCRRAYSTAASKPRLIVMEVKRLSPGEEQLLNRWAREGTRLKIEFSTQGINGWGEGAFKEWDSNGLSFDSAGCDFRIRLDGGTFEYIDATLSDKSVLDTHSRQVYLHQLTISWSNSERIVFTEYQPDTGVKPGELR